VSEPDFERTTRTAYDTIADAYAENARDGLATRAMDRALLSVFAELVTAAGTGRVADVGCGPGHVTAYLHGLGVAAFGVDVSPRMLAQARLAYPDLRFDEGSMTALDVPDGSLAGVVAFYSVIHVPPDRHPDVFAEFHRTLAPGGHVLVVFQIGDRPERRTEAFGHVIALDYHLLPPDRVAEQLRGAGLELRARLVREPDEDEAVPRAYLLARRPVSPR
jgi:SAM-dependent methyltransferase